MCGRAVVGSIFCCLLLELDFNLGHLFLSTSALLWTPSSQLLCRTSSPGWMCLTWVIIEHSPDRRQQVNAEPSARDPPQSCTLSLLLFSLYTNRYSAYMMLHSCYLETCHKCIKPYKTYLFNKIILIVRIKSTRKDQCTSESVFTECCLVNGSLN